ncbi:DUF6345 domain-containing protein [Streptomyces sp. H39-S7]|uniref:DUF6345 domain-containing protein n=1 Tax=Streptomyces sp. H39-S7 TaxID=3004357 RepID=UPI0022AF7AF5|nr:DUF6345 domain-containing protein [Streptomyces sp. H39-S7]MCZ4118201.1 DUF6345 domain-containing protein [Streptomyces sp. H39-S7]
MIYSDRGPSPLDLGKPGEAPRDSTFGWWGALSVEHFVNQVTLTHTHEDATGWLNYLQQFYDRNFWFADDGVKVWAYEETYDDWQDRYGMDAVAAVYHSGHGGMYDDGTFIAPLGGTWDNRSDALSSSMRLGNKKVNYVFWSTCNSLRVLDGHSPVRTWATPNAGFRMIFGFESTSVDHPGYGANFWKYWRGGQTFTDAWLNASWEISTHQAPSVAAAGTTQDEAINRLDAERSFSRDHIADNWYAWRWYYARDAIREPLMTLPGEPRLILLAPREPSSELLSVGRAAQFPEAALAEIQVERQGVLSATSGDRHISTGPGAVRWVKLAEPNRRNTEQISTEHAIAAAQAFAQQHANGTELVVDSVHDLMENDGSKEGELGEPRTVETMVVFRQMFHDVPVITPGRGEMRVSVDNDGTVVQALISTRRQAGSSRQLTSLVSEPRPGARGTVREAASPSAADPLTALATAQRHLLTELAAHAAAGPENAAMTGARSRSGSQQSGEPVEARDVPGTTQVGYEIEGNHAYLAARKLIEIGPEGGFVTRRWVIAPLAR